MFIKLYIKDDFFYSFQTSWLNNDDNIQPVFALTEKASY